MTIKRNDLRGGPGGDSLVPKNLTADIWKDALENAIVPGLAKSTPIIFGDNEVPMMTKRPAASIVGEGEQMKGTDMEVGSKKLHTVKARAGMEFTRETVEENPAHVLDALAEEISGAITRQIDLAVMHGRQASDGAQLTGGEQYLRQAGKVVQIDPSSPDEIDAALWEGYAKIVDDRGAMTGAAIDPRLTAILAQARYPDGRRVYPEISMSGASVGPFSSLSTGVGKVVSGQVDASESTDIIAIAGDYTALRFGHALNIPVKKVEYGDPLGNGDLQGRDCVAYLATAHIGWGIMDLAKFVRYELATGNGGDGSGE
ncbi:phage major capsid protein [Corynebacterium glyciniphilum]|uniref:phage major capsid protein n=1 Tax=Corynebacterium glyciniphilum TaxID=1404244 RepID=UPI00264F5B83|nr:phage major capsid protein [Corynebacterium glyciniphilum]MDN6706382.1 phage major capsid protein [Corynebacterium glyciniphilum]